MGSPGDRTLDISVQASPVTLVDGGASITQVNETLRTVVIPAIAPFDISSIPSYRPNNGTPLLPSNLASYISTQEHVCEALVKTVVTNSGPNSVIILGIDRVPVSCFHFYDFLFNMNFAGTGRKYRFYDTSSKFVFGSGSKYLSSRFALSD